MTGRFDPEGWAGPLVAAGAALLAVGVAALPGAWGLLGVIGVGLLALACVSARDGFLLLGPFWRTDLPRPDRRQRDREWRVVVALGCGTAVLFGYAEATDTGTVPPTAQAAAVAAVGFMLVGLLAVTVTAFGLFFWLAVVIGSDRRSKWNDFLLVTDLRGRELVIGRTLLGFAVQLRYPLAGLPLVVLLPLFEVDPAVVLLAFGYAAVSLFSVAGWMVVPLMTNPHMAGLCWCWSVFLAAPVGTGLLYLQSYPAVWAWPGTPTAPAAVTVADAVGWLNTANPIDRLRSIGAPGGVDLGRLAAELPAYAGVHLFVGVVSFALAARAARRPVADEPVPSPVAATRRPPVGDRPVLWKEAYTSQLPADIKMRQRPWLRRLGHTLAGLPFALVVLAAVFGAGGEALLVNLLLGGVVLSIGMVPYTEASHSLPLERERDTLVSLLTTPLSHWEITVDKLRGTVWGCRWAFGYAGALTLTAAVTGAVPWVGALALLLLLVVYVYAGTGLGGFYGADAPNRQAVTGRLSWFTIALLPLPGLMLVAPFLGHLSDIGVRFAVAALIPVLIGYTYYGRWLWRETARRFVESCDPARPDGPLLANEEKR